METGTIKSKSKEDLEKLIRKKLSNYQDINIDFEKGNSGRAWVKARNKETPKGYVDLFLFQFFIKK